jgi:thiamine biosynthesis lipoprotein
MGTVWSVSIAGGDEARARAAAGRALDEVARLETVLSEWIPGSEISRVNAAAGEAPVVVGEDLFLCAKVSLETARWSDGAYDISWAALRDLWRFGTNGRDVPPSREAVMERLPLWNYRRIRLDEANHSIFLEQRGMQIGLGGVAKGYALDRAQALLVQEGFENFMLYAGGQVLVRGLRGDRKWRVGIQHPRESRYFAFVEVTNASVATSGDYEHSFMYEGRRYHHILDPHTGFPSERSASVTVIAPTALWADAVDTAVFVMGPERGLEALSHAPGGPIEAVIVDPEMRIHATPRAAENLVLRAELDAAWQIGLESPRNAPDVRLSSLPPPVR